LDLLIEDERALALATAKASAPVLLFDRPWNQGELPQGVTRVKTWDEVQQLVRRASPRDDTLRDGLT
jgi:uncharacterized HAD superfamily protein